VQDGGPADAQGSDQGPDRQSVSAWHIYTHSCTRTHTHAHARAYTHTHTRTGTHACTRTYTHTHARTHARTHACNTRTHTHIHTRTHARTHVCMHVRTHNEPCKHQALLSWQPVTWCCTLLVWLAGGCAGQTTRGGCWAWWALTRRRGWTMTRWVPPSKHACGCDQTHSQSLTSLTCT